jgi:anti-sigma regulatory factor (Ser/Thr protein kinase)
VLLTVQRTHDEVYPAVPASVVRARHDLAGYASHAGVDEDQLDRIRLAVSEAVTNAVRHAYPTDSYPKATGQVQVTATAMDGELWILVADEGCGHQTASANPGLGWGLALIAEACDDFILAERSAGGTEARMRFDVA